MNNNLSNQIDIICVGKLKNTSAFYAGIADYSKRIKSQLNIIELTGHTQKDELSKITSKIDEKAAIICLDETGKNLTSSNLASKLGELSQNHSKLQFVIGGADGLDDSIRKKASLVLSFGQLTWPHMMVRLMLVEQIYRSQQILANHPYHRE
ncbi:MAG: 23S rRNA (pseudouridine(1915)-N(3))-methyltransferase RlmH [Pseudomonadota bacterium]